MTVGLEALPPPAVILTEQVPEWLRDCDYEWAIAAWRKASSQPGAWFDAAKADKVVELWPKLIVHTEDRFAGKPFRLNRWEEIIVRMLFGWKIPVDTIDENTGKPVVLHVRMFRKLLLWVARKNGKSEFLGGLALMFYAIEGVFAGQGFAFALNEAQGRMVFDKMTAMVQLSPPLQKKVVCFKKSLWLPQVRAGFQLLSGKAEGKHGRSPTVIAGDEMHEWTESTLELSNTLRQGTGTRLQPVELYASTAGLKSARVGFALWEETQALISGAMDDPTALPVIFAADPEDEIDDETAWRKANPTFPVSPTITFLRTECAKAKQSPRAEAHFRRYHLNQWVEQAVRWLPKKRWEACAREAGAWRNRAENHAGRRCYMAFDASATQDITAKVLLFEPLEPGGPLDVACEFFVPEDTIPLRGRRDRVAYEQWHRDGALTATPGDVVDQDYLRKAILHDLERYDVVQIGRDPWNSIKLVTDLQKDGVAAERFVDLRQGARTLGEPSKELERLVLAGSLDHGGHPVLTWMAEHVHVRFDENMNFVPCKKRSTEKIDGIVALVMTLALWMAGQDAGGLTSDMILARGGLV